MFCTWLKRHSWFVLLVYTHLWTSMAQSLLQPYFPPLAASRGIEAWKYAFVFSAYKVTRTLASMAGDKLMALTSVRRVFFVAQPGMNVFAVILGALYWSGSGNTLLAASLTLATLGGVIEGLYGVSLYTAAAVAYPGNTGVAIATLDSTWGVGHMLGSAIGGALVNLWAYPLPFFVLGTVALLSTPLLAARRAPEEKGTDPTPDVKCATPVPNYYKLLVDPHFVIDIVSMMLSWVIMGFNEPTMEPYLAEFNLNSAQIGVVFMVQYASYTLGSICSAIFCSYKMEAGFGLTGHLFAVFAYILLGPAPFIPCEPTLWMAYVAQVFIGIGTAAQFACHYCHAIEELSFCRQHGYLDKTRTIGFVSSVVFSSLVIGAIVTSPIAGYLVGAFGYRNGSMALLGLLVVWVSLHCSI
ncbi:unnamed protein product [Ixodes hexagonus]